MRFAVEQPHAFDARYRSAATTPAVQPGALHAVDTCAGDPFRLAHGEVPADDVDAATRDLAVELLGKGVPLVSALAVVGEAALRQHPPPANRHAAWAIVRSVDDAFRKRKERPRVTVLDAIGVWLTAHVRGLAWDRSARVLVGEWAATGEPVELPIDSHGHGMQHALLERVGDLETWAKGGHPRASATDVLRAARNMIPTVPRLEAAPSDVETLAAFVDARASAADFAGFVTLAECQEHMGWLTDDHGTDSRTGAALLALGWKPKRLPLRVDPKRRRAYFPPD